jgi:hypothetical protein
VHEVNLSVEATRKRNRLLYRQAVQRIKIAGIQQVRKSAELGLFW